MYCWGRWGDGEMGRLNNEHILYNRILYYRKIVGMRLPLDRG
ncbi:hypothetical protein [Okeania sp. SIO2C9]|nr:hypothetical protein [Okeania sp. SIO2C9]